MLSTFVQKNSFQVIMKRYRYGSGLGFYLKLCLQILFLNTIFVLFLGIVGKICIKISTHETITRQVRIRNYLIPNIYYDYIVKDTISICLMCIIDILESIDILHFDKTMQVQ